MSTSDLNIEQEKEEEEQDENTSRNKVKKRGSSLQTSSILSMSWPWSKQKRNSNTTDIKNRMNEDPRENATDKKQAKSIHSVETLHSNSVQEKPSFEFSNPLSSLTWPWSSSKGELVDDTQQAQIHDQKSGKNEVDAPGTDGRRGSGAKPLISMMWPWSRQSRDESKPTPDKSTNQLSASAKKSVTTTPSEDQSPLPTQDEVQGLKKPFFTVSWPWSSDKRPNEDPGPRSRSISEKQAAHGQPKPSSSTPFMNIKWPWSSQQNATEESKPQDPATVAAPDTKHSKGFSNRVAEFARKALPDKLLAITPWANPPAKAEEIVGHGTKNANKHDVIQLPVVHEPETKIHHRKRHSNLDDDVSAANSNTSLSDGGSFTFLDELNLLNLPIPEHLLASTSKSISPASNWDTAFHHLYSQAAADERYDPINTIVFREKVDHDDFNSDSSEGGRPSSTQKEENTLGERRSSPFLYSHRPFRMPKLANRQEEHSGASSNPKLFTFDPIHVSTTEWSNIHPGSETYIAATKWTFPEPIRADKQLLPQVDPLVKYKLKRLGRNRVTPADLEQTQREIAVGISPSGRKLDGYSSSSGEECVYKRVMCKNDPDFDIVQPYVETESGEKWPNPFLYYWNWKRTDENANEHYLHHQRVDKDHDLAQKRRIALEIDSHPMKIPYQNLGADDTDYEDPLGPLSTAPVTMVLDAFRHLLKSTARSHRRNGGGDAGKLTDPITRRYQYLLLDQYSNAYRKYYQFTLFCQAQRRRFYRTYMGMLGKYTSTCATVSTYPAWFFIWKGGIRYLIRRVPRKWKFYDARKVETVFYGTFASLYATQYIAEHDLLPNMDDPVWISQLALEKAISIKERFSTSSRSGSGRTVIDYVKMQRSKTYQKYLEWIGLLCRYQPIKMPPRVRKVFFLNYFNVLSIQTQILRIPEKENTTYLWEMKNFWEKTTGLAGFMELSLDEIYHGILRCNRIHPIKQVRVFEEHPVKGFPKEISPSRLSLDWLDPRIHFALSVGCKSCPPIHTFSLYEQDCQLDEVAKTYVRSRIKVNVEERLITLPILFLWYEKDFGNNKYIMLWYLKQFMLSKDMLKIRQLLTSGHPINFRYERFDDEIDHVVRRHPVTKCESVHHKKIIPVYWGNKF